MRSSTHGHATRSQAARVHRSFDVPYIEAGPRGVAGRQAVAPPRKEVTECPAHRPVLRRGGRELARQIRLARSVEGRDVGDGGLGEGRVEPDGGGAALHAHVVDAQQVASLVLA